MASVFHPDKDISYREINVILGIDHRTKMMGNGSGLTIDDIEKVLTHCGARCIRADYSGSEQSPPVPYQRYVYGSIESGFPAGLIFDTSSTAKHIVPVFGHTLNQDTWVPNAERGYFSVGQNVRYTPSEAWVSSMLIHDDNYGSNFCVPRHYLRTTGNTSSEWVAHVIGTLPSIVLLDPIRAELLALDFIYAVLTQMPQGDNEWGRRLVPAMKAGQCVLRPILLTGLEYGCHLEQIEGWSHGRCDPNVAKSIARSVGNRNIWMIELSFPELFSSNLRKVGEVVLWADQRPPRQRDFRSFVHARMPGYFAVYDSGSERSQFKFFPSGIHSHTPLLGSQ